MRSILLASRPATARQSRTRKPRLRILIAARRAGIEQSKDKKDGEAKGQEDGRGLQAAALQFPGLGGQAGHRAGGQRHVKRLRRTRSA